MGRQGALAYQKLNIYQQCSMALDRHTRTCMHAYIVDTYTLSEHKLSHVIHRQNIRSSFTETLTHLCGFVQLILRVHILRRMLIGYELSDERNQRGMMLEPCPVIREGLKKDSVAALKGLKAVTGTGKPDGLGFVVQGTN